MIPCDVRNASADALALLRAVVRFDCDSANAMLGTYSDPIDMAELMQAILSQSAFLVTVAARSAGMTEEDFLAGWISDIRSQNVES